MHKNQRGDAEVIGFFLVALVVIALIFAMFFVRFRTNDEVTSGIAYNTSNNAFISGNTNFSIRAGENTPVTEENQSTYCLAPDSPYKELVNKAAADKRVKLTVNSPKYFAIQWPWECKTNVTVTEVKGEQ